MLHNKDLSKGNWRYFPDCKALHTRAGRWNWMTIDVLRGERNQDEVYFYSKCQAELIRECHVLFQKEYPFLHRVYHSIFGKVK